MHCLIDKIKSERNFFHGRGYKHCRDTGAGKVHGEGFACEEYVRLVPK
jgi:hypothetical protein